MNSLVDPFGRKVKKLRISLTDKCNLRCHYCMPLNSTFMNEDRYLEAQEYFTVVRELCELGLEEVRLTGGEPLMRKSFSEIVNSLAELPLKKKGLTTNAVLLDRHLGLLKETGVHHLNISLDSLNSSTFHQVTHGNHLHKVLDNIERACAEGFQVKLNAVAMRGITDTELFDFISYAGNLNVEVRFLELMRIGHAREQQKNQFIAAQELITRLQEKYLLQPLPHTADSTSFRYLLDGKIRVGFIASETQAFCGQCSRWRLSADGIMRACLFKEDGLSIKNSTPEKRHLVYQQLLGMKPSQRPIEVSHQMNAIGG